MKDSDNLDAWLQIHSPMRASCAPWGPFGVPYNPLVFLRLPSADPPWNRTGHRRQLQNLTVIGNPLQSQWNLMILNNAFDSRLGWVKEHLHAAFFACTRKPYYSEWKSMIPSRALASGKAMSNENMNHAFAWKKD